MNKPICKLKVLNVRLPFMEAVEQARDYESGHIGFVKYNEDLTGFDYLYEINEPHGYMNKLYCKGTDEVMSGICLLSIDDFTHNDFRLLCAVGDINPFRYTYIEQVAERMGMEFDEIHDHLMMAIFPWLNGDLEYPEDGIEIDIDKIFGTL